MKNRYSLFAIIISCISLIWTIYHNIKLADIYINSDGKTQALFGIIELAGLSIKVWNGSLLTIAIASIILAIRRKEKKSFYIAAVTMNLMGIAALIIRFWRIMI